MWKSITGRSSDVDSRSAAGSSRRKGEQQWSRKRTSESGESRRKTKKKGEEEEEEEEEETPKKSSRSRTFDTESVASSYATAPSRREERPKRSSTFDDEEYQESSRRSEKRREETSARDKPSKDYDTVTYAPRSVERSSRSQRGIDDSLTRTDTRDRSSKEYDTVTYAPRSVERSSRSQRGIDDAPTRTGTRSDPLVAQQFPGQDPDEFAAPYRPPIASTEGGPGLASDFYGDQGQSVYDQPGIAPEVLINSQPHLMPALAEAKPPEETGHGAASDYYVAASSQSGQTSSSSKPVRPSAKPISGTSGNGISASQALAGAAGTAALGYTMSQQSQSYPKPSKPSSSKIQAFNPSHRPSSTQKYDYDRPEDRPSSNVGKYALGAAGVAAGAYALNHHSQHDHATGSSIHISAPYSPPQSALGMRGYQERKGPVTRLVDWWKDYEDVRKMELYTEAIGVCAQCFEPNSGSWNGPRKHHYHKRMSRSRENLRRSTESLRTGRIDKERRYNGAHGSDDEKKISKSSVLAGGAAAYGLYKAAEGLSRKDDEDDRRSSRHRNDGRSRRSISRDRRSDTSRGIIKDGDRYEIVSHELGRDGTYKTETRRKSRRSGSRSSSGSDHKMTSALVGAAAGAAALARRSSGKGKSRRSRSRSPNREYPGHHRRGGSHSSEERSHVYGQSNGSRSSLSRKKSRSGLAATGIGAGFLGGWLGSSSKRRSSKDRKRKGGIFSFSNGSSSDDGHSLAYGADIRRDHRKPKETKDRRRKSKISDEEGLNKTLLGLAATGAALTAAQAGRSRLSKQSSKSQLYAAKHRTDSDHRRKHDGPDEEGWEDESGESDSSYDNGLVYGDFRSRKSTDSLVSNGSGSWNFMGWRWGKGRKELRKSQENLSRKANFAPVAAIASAAAAGATISALHSRHEKTGSVTSSAPSMHSVYPIATGDSYSYDVGRADSRPVYTSRPESIELQAPQPVGPVPDALYSSVSPSFVTPSGPRVDFSSSVHGSTRTDSRRDTYDSSDRERRYSDREKRVSSASERTRRERRSSSPILDSQIGKEAAIIGATAAAVATAGVIASTRRSRRASSPVNSVRFDLESEKKHQEDRVRDKEGLSRTRDRDSREQQSAERARKERIDLETIAAATAAVAAKKVEDGRRERARRAAEDDERLERERLDRLADERLARKRAEDDRFERERLERLADERGRRTQSDEERRENERLKRLADERLAQKAEEDRRQKRDSGIKGIVGAAIAAGAGVAVASAVSSSKGKDRDVDRHDPPQPVIERKPVIHEYVPEFEPVIKEEEMRYHLEKGPGFEEIIPSGVIVDTFDEDFDPHYFKRKNNERRIAKKAATLVDENAEDSPDEVYRDLVDRYEHKNVDAGEFFKPKELRDTSDVSPSRSPNADVNITVYHADDDFSMSGALPALDKAPTFTQDKDGFMAPWPIPALNLIEPSPPGSRAGSAMGFHPDRREAPSPEPEQKSRDVEPENKHKMASTVESMVAATAAAEVITHWFRRRRAAKAKAEMEKAKAKELEEEDEDDDDDDDDEEHPITPAQRSRSESRVRFGEDKTHHYEVLTPESVVRSSYIASSADVIKPQRHDEIIVEEEDEDRNHRSSRSYKPEVDRKEKRREPESPVAEPFPRLEDREVDPTSRSLRQDKYESSKKRDKYAKEDVSKYEVVTPDKSASSKDDFYKAPYYDTVSDLGTVLAGRAVVDSKQLGSAEGGVLDKSSPTAERKMPGGFDEDDDDEEEHSSKYKKDTKAKAYENAEETKDVNVYDYLDKDPKPQTRKSNGSRTAEPAEYDDDEDSDDEDLEESVVSSAPTDITARTSKSEGHEKRKSKSSRRSRDDDDDIRSEPGRSRKDKTRTSSPPDEDRERRREKRKSRRDQDDDTASVVSTAVSERGSKRDKDKSKKERGGILGMFSRSSTDLTEPSSSKSKSRTADSDDRDRERRKRKKDKERDKQRSDDEEEREKRSHKDRVSSDSKHKSRTNASDDEADDSRREGKKEKIKSNYGDESFLGERAEEAADELGASAPLSVIPLVLGAAAAATVGVGLVKGSESDDSDDNDYEKDGRMARDLGDEPQKILPSRSTRSPDEEKQLVSDEDMVAPALSREEDVDDEVPRDVLEQKAPAQRNLEALFVATAPKQLAHRAMKELSQEDFVDLPELPHSRPTSPIEIGSHSDLPDLPMSRPGSPTAEQVKTPPRPSLESLRASSRTAVPFKLPGRPPASDTLVTPARPMGHRKTRSSDLRFAGNKPVPLALTSGIRSPASDGSPVSPFARRFSFDPASRHDSADNTPRGMHFAQSTRRSRTDSAERRLPAEPRPMWLVSKYAGSSTPPVDERLPELPPSREESRSPTRGNREPVLEGDPFGPTELANEEAMRETKKIDEEVKLPQLPDSRPGSPYEHIHERELDQSSRELVSEAPKHDNHSDLNKMAAIVGLGAAALLGGKAVADHFDKIQDEETELIIETTHSTTESKEGVDSSLVTDPEVSAAQEKPETGESEALSKSKKGKKEKKSKQNQFVDSSKPVYDDSTPGTPADEAITDRSIPAAVEPEEESWSAQTTSKAKKGKKGKKNKALDFDSFEPSTEDSEPSQQVVNEISLALESSEAQIPAKEWSAQTTSKGKKGKKGKKTKQQDFDSFEPDQEASSSQDKAAEEELVESQDRDLPKESDDWATQSSGKTKKAKKGKKSKYQDLDSFEPSADDVVSVPVQAEEPIDKEYDPAADPTEETWESQTPAKAKKGKKGKKNKLQDFDAFEPSTDDTPAAENAQDTIHAKPLPEEEDVLQTQEITADPIAEPKSEERDLAIDDSEPAIDEDYLREVQDEEQAKEIVEDPVKKPMELVEQEEREDKNLRDDHIEQAADEPLDLSLNNPVEAAFEEAKEDDFSTASKKTKKGKKSKRQQEESWDDEPESVPETQESITPVESRDLDIKDSAEFVDEPLEEPTFEQPAKKGKKGKKNKPLETSTWDEEPSQAPEVQDTITRDVDRSIPATEPLADEPAFEQTMKKSKKDKKGKRQLSVSWDDELEKSSEAQDTPDEPSANDAIVEEPSTIEPIVEESSFKDLDDLEIWEKYGSGKQTPKKMKEARRQYNTDKTDHETKMQTAEDQVLHEDSNKGLSEEPTEGSTFQVLDDFEIWEKYGTGKQSTKKMKEARRQYEADRADYEANQMVDVAEEPKDHDKEAYVEQYTVLPTFIELGEFEIWEKYGSGKKTTKKMKEARRQYDAEKADFEAQQEASQQAKDDFIEEQPVTKDVSPVDDLVQDPLVEETPVVEETAVEESTIQEELLVEQQNRDEEIVETPILELQGDEQDTTPAFPDKASTGSPDESSAKDLALEEVSSLDKPAPEEATSTKRPNPRKQFLDEDAFNYYQAYLEAKQLPVAEAKESPISPKTPKEKGEIQQDDLKVTESIPSSDVFDIPEELVEARDAPLPDIADASWSAQIPSKGEKGKHEQDNSPEEEFAEPTSTEPHSEHAEHVSLKDEEIAEPLEQNSGISEEMYEEPIAETGLDTWEEEPSAQKKKGKKNKPITFEDSITEPSSAREDESDMPPANVQSWNDLDEFEIWEKYGSGKKQTAKKIKEARRLYEADKADFEAQQLADQPEEALPETEESVEEKSSEPIPDEANESSWKDLDEFEIWEQYGSGGKQTAKKMKEACRQYEADKSDFETRQEADTPAKDEPTKEKSFKEDDSKPLAVETNESSWTDLDESEIWTKYGSGGKQTTKKMKEARRQYEADKSDFETRQEGTETPANDQLAEEALPKDLQPEETTAWVDLDDFEIWGKYGSGKQTAKKMKEARRQYQADKLDFEMQQEAEQTNIATTQDTSTPRDLEELGESVEHTVSQEQKSIGVEIAGQSKKQKKKEKNNKKFIALDDEPLTEDTPPSEDAINSETVDVEPSSSLSPGNNDIENTEFEEVSLTDESTNVNKEATNDSPIEDVHDRTATPVLIGAGKEILPVEEQSEIKENSVHSDEDADLPEPPVTSTTRGIDNSEAEMHTSSSPNLPDIPSALIDHSALPLQDDTHSIEAPQTIVKTNSSTEREADLEPDVSRELTTKKQDNSEQSPESIELAVTEQESNFAIPKSKKKSKKANKIKGFEEFAEPTEEETNVPREMPTLTELDADAESSTAMSKKDKKKAKKQKNIGLDLSEPALDDEPLQSELIQTTAELDDQHEAFSTLSKKDQKKAKKKKANQYLSTFDDEEEPPSDDPAVIAEEPEPDVESFTTTSKNSKKNSKKSKAHSFDIINEDALKAEEENPSSETGNFAMMSKKDKKKAQKKSALALSLEFDEPSEPSKAEWEEDSKETPLEIEDVEFISQTVSKKDKKKGKKADRSSRNLELASSAEDSETPINKESVEVEESLKSKPVDTNIELAAASAAALRESGFDTALVLDDPVFSRPSSRARGLEEPDFDDFPQHASMKNSRRGSRRQSRSQSVDRTREGLSDEIQKDPVPMDDAEFAAVLTAGLKEAGYDPDSHVTANDKAASRDVADDDIMEIAAMRHSPKSGWGKTLQRKSQEDISNEISHCERGLDEVPDKVLEVEDEPKLDLSSKKKKKKDKKPSKEETLDDVKLDEPTDAVEDWDVPVKQKKKKKAKKGEVLDESTLDNQEMGEPSRAVEEDWDAPMKQKKKKKGKREDVLEEPIMDDQQQYEASQVKNEEWDAPSKPKKKDKKKKRITEFYVPAEESALPTTHSKSTDGDSTSKDVATGLGAALATAGAAAVAMHLLSTKDTEMEDDSIESSKRVMPAAFEEDPLPKKVARTDDIINRDSAIVMEESPSLPSATPRHQDVRDSGFHGTPQSPIQVQVEVPQDWDVDVTQEDDELPIRDDEGRELPSVVESTSRDRGNALLFQSSPSSREAPSFVGITEEDDDKVTPKSVARTPARGLNIIHTSEEESPLARKSSFKQRSVSGPAEGLRIRTSDSSPGARSPSSIVSVDDLIARRSWPPIDEENETVGGIDAVLHSREQQSTPSESRTSSQHRHTLKHTSPRDNLRSASIGSDRSIANIGRLRSPDFARPSSVASNRSDHFLRRVSSKRSADLRSARSSGERLSPIPGMGLAAAGVGAIAAGAVVASMMDDKSRSKDMDSVYEGVGDLPGSPRSPRPPSIRKRQSLHLLDLQSRVEQLQSENRSLHDARTQAEQLALDASTTRDSHANIIRNAEQAVADRDVQIREKEESIRELQENIENMQNEIDQLAQENAQLTEQNQGIASSASDLANLKSQHDDTHKRWQDALVGIAALEAQHKLMNNKMENMVREEIAKATADQEREIERLQSELEASMEQIKQLQQQLVSSKQSNESFLTLRDEDYFDSACQQMCQHLQQWVLRFSKFSDSRQCRLSSEIKDDKIVNKLDDAILDGSDVDNLLADRVKRRDVFMSIVMSLIWEHIFTRYLFGLDQSQRQKLKSIEKQLMEIGPQSAVAQWRAITLTLLSRRDAFQQQRTSDTEAVTQEVYYTLRKLLPPPKHLEEQIVTSLRKVMAMAVELSVQMRTQKPEYVMLPPLKPEYDTNGDLVAKVPFSASLMNERSGEAFSNDDLEARQATVKIVLFPLVVKKGDDNGEGDEEIVVCPAQVLVTKEKGKKVGFESMDIDPRQSTASFVDNEITMQAG